MCGIFGITATENNVVPRLKNSLEHLAYRGYDSSGVCLEKDGLTVLKALGDTTRLTPKFQHLQASTAIGHTRWATHGGITEANAHPHTSHQSIAIVHNGIINNHMALRNELVEAGYAFQTETDTEVIAHLFHKLLQNHSPLSALNTLKSLLQGRYAFIALLKAHPGEIFGLTNNMPLLIGKDENGFSVASDLFALKHCHSFARLQAECHFSISASGASLPLMFETMPTVVEENAATQPHKTLEEIYAQADLPRRILNHWDHKAIACLSKPKHVVFVACGSSYHCANVAKHWLMEKGILVTLEVASELKSLPVPLLDNTWIIAISQSGETADTLLCLQSLKCQHSIAITNTPTSTLAHLCDTVIPTHAGVEHGVASTKAVTAQLLSLYLLCQSLEGNPSLPEKPLQDSIHQLLAHKDIPLVAKHIASYPHIICLGKHALLSIAEEFALKLKELTYIHAEALPIGELKHGPLALIDENVLCIVLGEETSPHIQTTIAEIKARNGHVLLIGPNASGKNCIATPPLPSFDFLIINIACQLLAYHSALSLSRPIDKPRNLAKSVTVE